MDARVETNFATATFPTTDFRAAIRALAPILNGRHTVPPSLQLISRNGAAALHAMNLETELTVPIGAAEPPYTTLNLPAPALLRLFNTRWPAGELTLTPKREDCLSVTIDNEIEADFAIEHQQHSPLVKSEATAGIRIDRETFLAAITTCQHAISTEETRYYLNGVHIGPHPTDAASIILAATDGHRLVKRVIAGVKHSLTEGIIIPRATVQLLRTLMKAPPYNVASQGDDVDITIHNPTRIVVASAAFRLASWLIDGHFPDYERVIPREAQLVATFPTAPLRRFCTRLAAMGQHAACGVSLQFERGAKTMLATWRSANIGEMKCRLDAAVETTVSIGFQHRYIINALDALCCDTITLSTRGPSDPVILATAGELSDPSTTIVIMPMRV